MADLHTHADVIALWPTTAEFAKAVTRELGDGEVKASNARVMLHRRTIPPRFYEAVAAAAQRAGFEGITYARLTELGRRATTT